LTKLVEFDGGVAKHFIKVANVVCFSVILGFFAILSFSFARSILFVSLYMSARGSRAFLCAGKRVKSRRRQLKPSSQNPVASAPRERLVRPDTNSV